MTTITAGAELYRQRHGNTTDQDQDDQASQDQPRGGLTKGRTVYLARHGDTAARDRLVTWETAPPEPTDVTPGGDAA